MKITTKDIVKNLPLPEELKNELLTNLDSYDPDVKFKIVQALWDTYTALYYLKLEENMRLAFYKAQQNQEKLNKDFYKKIRKQTQQDLQTDLAGLKTSSELSSIRQKIEKLIN